MVERLASVQNCLEGGLILLKLWVQIPPLSFYLKEGSFKQDHRVCAIFYNFFHKKAFVQKQTRYKNNRQKYLTAGLMLISAQLLTYAGFVGAETSGFET